MNTKVVVRPDNDFLNHQLFLLEDDAIRIETRITAGIIKQG
jgi:hypothetical protein